jgi:hypothetical protein
MTSRESLDFLDDFVSILFQATDIAVKLAPLFLLESEQSSQGDPGEINYDAMIGPLEFSITTSGMVDINNRSSSEVLLNLTENLGLSINGGDTYDQKSYSINIVPSGVESVDSSLLKSYVSGALSAGTIMNTENYRKTLRFSPVDLAGSNERIVFKYIGYPILKGIKMIIPPLVAYATDKKVQIQFVEIDSSGPKRYGFDMIVKDGAMKQATLVFSTKTEQCSVNYNSNSGWRKISSDGSEETIRQALPPGFNPFEGVEEVEIDSLFFRG